MATFVLVHGSWHGGWCWRRITPLLRSAGHDVYTPTLTGLGERSHLLSPQVSLATHVTDIANALRYEDLRNVVLVGHSYAGMVITAVAEQCADQIDQLVYLDAFVPDDGACLNDYLDPAVVAGLRAEVDAEGEGWKQPPLFEFFGLDRPADIAWVRSKACAHPYRTNQDLVELSNPRAASLRRTYIEFTKQLPNSPPSPFRQFAERARKRGWHVGEIATGHDAMITAPEQLAGVLRGLVDEPKARPATGRSA